jgi:hypothetical protein
MNLLLSIVTKILYTDERPYVGALRRGRFPVTNRYIVVTPPPTICKSVTYSIFQTYSLPCDRYCPKSSFGAILFPYLYRYAHRALPSASIHYKP